VTLRELGSLSDEVVAAFRADAQALGARIKATKEQLATLPEVTTDTSTAQELHVRLLAADLPALVQKLAEQHDSTGLRELLQATVQSARLVERARSGSRTVWARADVVWSPDAALLLEAGLLTLGPPFEPPVVPAAHERMLERARRYRAKRKAAGQ
jgi:hypothetical protein